ncbi:MAG: 3-dehydroquinate synthase II [Candidatus Heimdallarchaeota archaeon]|nr:3-dehydroquinate synthase II [Candidatus Heimdallarchaeota archaeon]MDH5645084.1 3-dehydroquinate synthase II [Candidatus Heimdallarchaeota archaeon]
MKIFLTAKDTNSKLMIPERYTSGIYLIENEINQISPSIHETEIIILDSNEKIITTDSKVIGEKYLISDAISMEGLMNRDVNEFLEYLLIETSDWLVIPLENLIAKFNQSKTSVIAIANSIQDFQLFERILEIGISGCIIQFPIDQLIKYLETNLKSTINLLELKISSISNIGIGDRVCVDTCANLKKGEGLLVGGTAAAFVLVEAEVYESGFVNSRPFRINAGVVSSYVLNGKNTNYLSEFRAGKEITIINEQGVSRTEYVARVKIEKRPLILIHILYDNKEYPIILQNAETVNLITPEGSKSVVNLKVNDIIIGWISNKARHFGLPVDEFIEER